MSSIPAAAEVAAALRDAGGRVTFVSGNFNILHPGHLRLLKFAADAGDVLVVGVTPDGSANVTVPAEARLEAIGAIAIVDHAVQLTGSAEAFIRELRPGTVVKGKEYEHRDNPERAALAEYGGTLMFSSGEMRFPSLDLLHREYFETRHLRIDKPLDTPSAMDSRSKSCRACCAGSRACACW